MCFSNYNFKELCKFILCSYPYNYKTSVVAKAVKTIADKMAKTSYGTASGWMAYQPKEPVKKK